MTLEEKISLINQMIKEDSDNTIRHYLDLLREIETIEKTLYGKRRA